MLNLYEIKKIQMKNLIIKWFGFIDVLALSNTLIFPIKY